MSQADLEKFYEDVLQDQTLQERLTSVNLSGNMAALAVGLGKENGYDFTVKEVEAKAAELNESSSTPMNFAGNGICWKSS
jgi:predicted ribosomally synthesized peptide with nif11-like leader